MPPSKALFRCLSAANSNEKSLMTTIVLDNVETVKYLDSMTKGRLSGIQVIFSKSGRIGSYFGPGLRLALALLKDQFPPQTDAERISIERPVPTVIDFVIDPNTLEISAPSDKLKNLGYLYLLAAEKQTEMFSYFRTDGRPFNIGGLRKEIRRQIVQQKPQA